MQTHLLQLYNSIETFHSKVEMVFQEITMFGWFGYKKYYKELFYMLLIMICWIASGDRFGFIDFDCIFWPTINYWPFVWSPRQMLEEANKQANKQIKNILPILKLLWSVFDRFVQPPLVTDRLDCYGSPILLLKRTPRATIIACFPWNIEAAQSPSSSSSVPISMSVDKSSSSSSPP